MTDHDALYAAVLDRPDEDTPRLVLADYLDDHGQPARADFIRVGCHLGRWTCDFKQTPEQPGWRHDCGTDDRGYWLCQPLRSRERELFDRHKAEWCGGDRWAVLLLPEDDPDVLPELTTAVVRRGFVDEVRLTLAAFVGGPCGRCEGEGRREVAVENIGGYSRYEMEGCRACDGTGRTPGLAAELFRLHPITRVRPIDREPRHVSDGLGRGWTWSRQREGSRPTIHTIPGVVRDLLPRDKCQKLIRPYTRWDTDTDAEDALSAALVDFGRALARAGEGAGA
jgi:uncharacterized protein (TIGR02996 family)